MGNFKTELFYALACIGVIFIIPDFLGEGATTYYIGAFVVSVLTCMMITDNKK